MKKVNIIIVISILLVVLVKRNESFIWKVLSHFNIVDNYIYFENRSSRYPNIDIMWRTPDYEARRSFVVGEYGFIYKDNKKIRNITDASNENFLGFYCKDSLLYVSSFFKYNYSEKAYIKLYLVDLDADHTALVGYLWQRGRYYIGRDVIEDTSIPKKYRELFQRCLH